MNTLREGQDSIDHVHIADDTTEVRTALTAVHVQHDFVGRFRHVGCSPRLTSFGGSEVTIESHGKTI